MNTKAYIHEYGNGKLEPEHLDVKTVLESRGINSELFTTKRLRRNQLVLDKHTLIVGDHPTIETVFKRIDYSKKGSSYPLSLRKYLKRSIWESSLRNLLREAHSKDILNIFIKPKLKDKLFTGFIVLSNTDLIKLHGISKHTDLYCSTVVNWRSEYRVFVNQSKIVGVKHYAGDRSLTLNMTEVKSAIAEFELSSDRTDGYGIDFGVLANGEIALVEWNDGFALGSYGLDGNIYTDLILSRWEEILKETFATKT